MTPDRHANGMVRTVKVADHIREVRAQIRDQILRVHVIHGLGEDERQALRLLKCMRTHLEALRSLHEYLRATYR